MKVQVPSSHAPPPGRAPAQDRVASRRSLLALDALAFILPDVQAGIGPFLVLYLAKVLHWEPGRIGWVMGATGLVGLVVQAPAGALIDRVRAKRGLLAIAVSLVALSCLMMVTFPGMGAVLLGQSLIGVLGAVFGPTLAALSLGMVGRRRLERRIGRNAALAAAGNVGWALATGALGAAFGVPSMFYLAAAMALPSLLALAGIRAADIDPDLARGRDDGQGPVSPWALLRVKGLAALLASAFLFHFANAAVLTLATQRIAGATLGRSSLYVSALVVVNQLVTVPVAALAGRLAGNWARKPLFLIAFMALPLRCVLCMFAASPAALVALQVLDGLGAGVFGVMQVLVIADLSRGSGWFNLAQASVGTAIGLGATLSNLLAGEVAQRFGYGPGFGVLALIALAALAVFWLRMPETHRKHA